MRGGTSKLNSGDGVFQRIAAGDRDRVHRTSSAPAAATLRFLVKLVREREMAEEVLNETLLDVWRQAGRFEGKSSVPT